MQDENDYKPSAEIANGETDGILSHVECPQTRMRRGADMHTCMIAAMVSASTVC